jgi:RNA 2',3'-cyclic 3'-phosphodiesterase
MRLFIAIDFNGSRDALKDVQKDLAAAQGSARISYPKEYHLTLKFLGDVQDPQPVIQALQEIRYRSFKAQLHGIGYFPDARKPRVVWVGVEPKQAFMALQQKIEKALNELFPKDTKFRPHITLGRIKQGRIDEFNPDMPEIMVDVNSFKLIMSDLLPDGPKYSTISSFDLD